MKIKRFAVIGGDLRSLKLADLIKEDGNNVSIYGFNNTKVKLAVEITENLHKAIDQNDVVIAPLPCSNDDETINAPFSTEKIYINDVFRMMDKKQLFIAGRISSKIAHLAQVYNVYSIDILDREEMAVLNAIPTAEGAIQIAMEELPITLHSSNALILGFGRIGKILAKMLHGIGVNVYVEARKYSDIAWIKSYGYKPIFINELGNYVSLMDVIFNTIPALILNEELLKKINKDCLIIDLASKPGGVDFEKARLMGLKVNWALSLPGKVAPVTAAKFIKDTIYNILDELGV
ncbi:MAG: dipicolinate synthase subunit DpsA [Firmicutes bacterium]|nr:dipicolinate synthase subunit DpsA [Bacillota bacterium]